MHLYGWRQAETFYNNAYEMKPSPGLGDKRFLALCLTAIREKHEKIVNPLVYKEIDVLAASEGFPKTQKYRESNQVFDFMLANQEMYRGEAYYYKAYNYYHMKEPVKARELIDRAKSLLPLSGEVFFLSGLLYYNQGKLKEAEKDFLRTLYDNQYSPCYPLYYLGLIKLKNQDWSFIKDFSDSIRHFELAVENMSNKLNEIDLMEIEVHQKEWMKKRQKGTKKSSGY